MMIWLIFVAMMTAVMAALVVALWRQPAGGRLAGRADYDRMVFRDQLSELDRDLARGSIAAPEAEAARNEIARRILHSAAAPQGRFGRSSRPAAGLIGVLLIPAVALPLYLHRGSPRLPDVPLAQRLEKALQNQDFEALIAKVEKHLGETPDDAEGWRVLAPAYRNAQRWGDAADAYANLLRLTAPTAELMADYGEMLVFASQGMVTAGAHGAFAEALRLDPKLPKARFYDGIALKQEGRRDEARAALTAFLAESPADASWRTALEAELADLDSAAPVLSQEQMAAGTDMPAGDRDTMIRSMVDGLEARLAADGSDLAGWQRLIRARVVLNEPDKAKAALATAKEHFKDRPDALAALAGLAQELRVE